MTAGLLRAEFRKIFSTRLWWALLAPVVLLSLMINLFGGLFSAGITAGADGPLPFLLASMAYALVLTNVFAAVHGVVATAGEFRHRTVTTTYLTAAGRGGVLAAKMVSSAAIGMLYATVAVLVGAIAGLLGESGVPPMDALLTVAFIGVLTGGLWAALGAALGTIISNQAGVVVVLLLYMLIGENLISLLISNADAVASLTSYLPANAGEVALYDIPAQVLLGAGQGAAAVEGLAGVTSPPAWWGALLVLAAWTAAAAGAGWVIGDRRDVT